MNNWLTLICRYLPDPYPGPWHHPRGRDLGYLCVRAWHLRHSAGVCGEGQGLSTTSDGGDQHARRWGIHDLLKLLVWRGRGRQEEEGDSIWFLVFISYYDFLERMED